MTKITKPELQTAPQLNLVRTLEYLESIGNTGIYDRFWAYMMGGYNFGNDRYLTFWLKLNKADKKGMSPLIIADIELIKDTWGLHKEDYILMDVAW